MLAIRRRALGVLLCSLAVLLLTQPLALWSALEGATLPDLAEPATIAGAAPAALVAAGAVVAVSGLAAVGGRSLAPRSSLSAPVVGVIAGLGLAVAAGVDPATIRDLAMPEAHVFVLAGAVAGGSVAPVTLGALKGDTVALLAGAAVLLVAGSLSPAPGFTLAAGLLGGGFAVALLWGVDRETWVP